MNVKKQSTEPRVHYCVEKSKREVTFAADYDVWHRPVCDNPKADSIIPFKEKKVKFI